jgi:hypothetical protein
MSIRPFWRGRTRARVVDLISLSLPMDELDKMGRLLSHIGFAGFMHIPYVSRYHIFAR